MHNSKPTCLICKEKVSVVKEYNVRRHYETKHSEYAKFSKELKTRKLDSLKSELRNQQRLLNSSIHSSSDTVKASYSVAMIISKRMKSFSDGEFVKECLDAVVKDILPDKTKKFSNISLSRQTICRRVNDISNEIVVTLRDQIKYFKSYSLAFDECTDISDTSQLVVYIRGVTESFQVKQEMLNLVSLKDTTKGEDIFQAVMKCLSDNGANLETLAGLTTDGAPAMIGRNKGVVKLIMDEMESRSIKNDLFVIHCLIHQHNLCAQVLSMNHVMSVVVRTINFIRSHALQHRQFKELLNELYSHYGDLVYFSNVRWLSRGKCLKRFFDLREEIKSFMMHKKMTLTELNDEEWMLDLCFLVDITEKINQLNKELQGQDNLITNACHQVKAFRMKLSLFECQIRNGNDQHFPTLINLKSAIVKFLQVR
ncbi:general transcription factor II-I repeat domain-containing protein 2B-like [Octopus sinensis]|uniref:General transcription factor II-I repeat domain-containing protein 2B-like n=2 Tax=Octopus sinensis TaxID=2607531 RepID=A0A6P7U434_9MOLL|nr:general transcription factor II-I repeat domain-containing protein 2B-like [Octopus sinensis]